MTTITHDPDEGCAGTADAPACPFLVSYDEGYRYWCAIEPDGCELDEHRDKRAEARNPAPPWCPLRSGPVVVRAKR